MALHFCHHHSSLRYTTQHMNKISSRCDQAELKPLTGRATHSQSPILLQFSCPLFTQPGKPSVHHYGGDLLQRLIILLFLAHHFLSSKTQKTLFPLFHYVPLLLFFSLFSVIWMTQQLVSFQIFFFLFPRKEDQLCVQPQQPIYLEFHFLYF